jgi:hypothetical protein
MPPFAFNKRCHLLPPFLSNEPAALVKQHVSIFTVLFQQLLSRVRIQYTHGNFHL